MPLDSAWFDGFNKDLRSATLWDTFYRSSTKQDTVPPVPQVDGEALFWEMMRSSRAPDPWMWPALKQLKSSGRYILAALSNTIIFPPSYDHKFADLPVTDDVRAIFDIFISSAHVGMRKPNEDIYLHALQEVDRFARDASKNGRQPGWEEGVRAKDVLFLDDIGENLKMGKRVGFRTVKVHLGRAYEAVDTLEEITALSLAGDHPRVPVKPVVVQNHAVRVAKL
jgi:FMN phosphatase YigB (HAD superfamily)